MWNGGNGRQQFSLNLLTLTSYEKLQQKLKMKNDKTCKKPQQQQIKWEQHKKVRTHIKSSFFLVSMVASEMHKTKIK